MTYSTPIRIFRAILLTLYSVAFIGISASAQTGNVYIPDDNFKKALVDDHDDIDTDRDRNISYAEARAYTGKIRVDALGIKTLEGIEAFTRITELICAENQLMSLDVRKNTQLTRLNCGENKLTALDVSKNTELRSLTCVDNQLTILDISKNTKLTNLFCEKNKLTKLDISKNTKLHQFFCFNNQITALDVTKNTELSWLECNNNQLTTLDVSKCIKMNIFYCQSNKLKAINLKNGNNKKHLADFDATKNPQLTCIRVDDPTAFKKDFEKSVDKPNAISNDCIVNITNISNSSNTQNQLLDDLEIFPNPSQDRLSIETSHIIRQITITDLAGKALKTIDGNHQSIDVSTLNPNIYFLKLSTENGIIYRKFLKE